MTTPNYISNERIEYLKSMWNVPYSSEIHRGMLLRDLLTTCEMNLLIRDDNIYNDAINEYTIIIMNSK